MLLIMHLVYCQSSAAPGNQCNSTLEIITNILNQEKEMQK